MGGLKKVEPRTYAQSMRMELDTLWWTFTLATMLALAMSALAALWARDARRFVLELEKKVDGFEVPARAAD